MARKESAAEVKQRLIAQLRESRQALSREAKSAQEQYQPTAIAARSFQKHKTAWIIGGAVAGLLAIRLLLPGKNRSDISGKTAKKRAFSGLLGGLVWTLARQTALNYARDHLQDRFKDTLSSYFDRPGPRP